MKIKRAMWLHEQHELLLEELCELSGLSEGSCASSWITAWLAPIDSDAQHWTFGADRLIVARSARRLRKDFDLDPHGVALAVTLLERVPRSREELRDLRAKLPGGGAE